MGFQYLTYRQIDKQKWDACIERASNGLVYAFSFYLDAMALQWDALVYNDYEAVMPLTWNKKYGIYYLYQPPFTACLGVFGRSINAQMVNDFLLQIPEKFKYWDIALNYGNNFGLKDHHLKQRMNYVLSLNNEYAKIREQFNDNIKRNVRKSIQYQLNIKKDIPVQEIVELAREQASEFSKITSTDFEHFSGLYRILQQKEQAITYGVYLPSGQLLASAVFFFSHQRAYYILVGNHPNGKTLGASHTLINAFIEDHAGKHLLLDFEGSDIHSLAFFYSSFGAHQEEYPSLRLNRLPAALKWLKKS